MSRNELEQIVGKMQKLKALQRARDRVIRLERELRGEAVGRETPDDVPEFLRPRTAGQAS
jgi:hypothetical protein